MEYQVNNSEFSFKDNIIVILGGLGFIGKNLIEKTLRDAQFKQIITVDKTIPVLSYLDVEIQQHYKTGKLLHYQADLSKIQDTRETFQTIVNTFGQINYVVNLCQENRFGFEKIIYKINILQVTENVIQVCTDFKIDRLIQFSSATIYNSKDKARTENAKINVSNNFVNKYLYKSEQLLEKQKAINYVILRPSYVYGNYNQVGLTFRIMGFYIYKHLNEEQLIPWDESRNVNTVNVEDVCRSILFCLENQNIQSGDIYNISDNSKTTSGKISKMLSTMIGGKYQHVGAIKSHLALLNTSGFLKELNKKHVIGWIELCSKSGINDSILSLVLYPENTENYQLFVDGSLITKKGFKYKYPNFNEEILMENLKWLIYQKWVPELENLKWEQIDEEYKNKKIQQGQNEDQKQLNQNQVEEQKSDDQK